MHRTSGRLLRLQGLVMIVLYLALLVYFLFFSEKTGRIPGETLRYNLTPFLEIRRFWVYRSDLGFEAVFLNLAGNVIAFVPFGALLPVVLPSFRNIVRTTLAGLLFSSGVEVLQLVTKLGSFDVDDILLNTAGVVLGYLLFEAYRRIRRQYLSGRKTDAW